MRKKQGYNARLDESLGERNRKKKAAPKTKRTTKRAATLSPDINQHKRMAMGENVLTGKMIKRAKGGMAGRRKESEGMEKAKGRRKYAAVGTMDKGKKTKQRGGRTAADSAKSERNLKKAVSRKLESMMGRGKNPVKKTAPVKKQRGGRTAADSARAVQAAKASMPKLKRKWDAALTNAGKSRAGYRTGVRNQRGLKKGGRAPATTGVNLNMGAPKVRTITARGMGAALRGGQFRENT
jgi:hypothetical protein